MNGKMKAVLIIAVVMGLVASAVFVVPTLAYMNGDTDQTRGRDRDQTRDRDRLCYSTCTMDQTRLQQRLRDCTQNETAPGPAATQYQHQYQYQYGHA